MGGVRSAKPQDENLYWKRENVALEADGEELLLFRQVYVLWKAAR